MSTGYFNRPLQISIDGEGLDTDMMRCAASAFVRQTLNAPSLAEISFAEPPVNGVKALHFGAELALRLDNASLLFRGETTTIEHQRDGAGGHVVRLRAYDRLHRLRKKQQARAIPNVTVSDTAAQAARDLGVDIACRESGPTRTLAVQYETSDLEFLTEFAADSGLQLYLDGDVLRLFTLAGEDDPVELKVGRELASARSVATVETMRRSTSSHVWNVLRNTAIDREVSLARQDAEDMRSIDTSSFGDIGARVLYNRLATSAAEADALSQADLDQAAAAEIIIEGEAEGNPRLRPGRAIRILGIDDNVDGQFTLTEALHTFSEEAGYITGFSTKPPPRRLRNRTPVLTMGKVFDLSDPDNLSRIRVRLPLMGNLESDWMPVLSIGAGRDKGFAVMPEDGDSVLVALPDGNPAYGIVLGGLYGESNAPGASAASGKRPFIFRTANGQIFTLDSANALARIETSGGDVFELGPKGTKLHASRDLTIEAPGRTVTIRAKAVEFEEG
jgi:phage baseplate assembly protein gpV/phage protein D